MLVRLADLLRLSLEESDNAMIPVHRELALLEAFLEVERVRFGDALRVVTQTGSGVADLLVPRWVLQPLVENAIKHGIGPRRYGGEIGISARLENVDARPKVLVIEVSDSGMGVSESALHLGRSRGLGLAHIEERLQAHYGDEATLSLVSRVDEGTCVTLRVPTAVPPRTAQLPSFVAAGRA
jgi:sensor histidine kinase YesM